MFENSEPLSGLHYEIRFSVYTGHKIDQDHRNFVTTATSYSDAIRKFLLWANDGKEKEDRNRYGIEPKKKRFIKFEKYPVTEECIQSITKWNY